MFYEDLRVGEYAEFSKTITEADIVLFSGVTGDFNPMHVDETIAASSRFQSRIAHGMLSASLLCSVYGMRLPGAGSIHLEQRLQFLAPVRIGDTVTAHVEVLELCERCRVRVRSWCSQQDGIVVVEGEALLIAPSRPECAQSSTT